MGWNGSGNKSAAPVSQKTVKTPPSKWRGLIAFAVIVVGGIAAWFALRPTETEPETKREARGTKHDIAEVKPQIATNRVEEAKPKAYSEMSREEKLNYWREKYGNNIPDNLKSTVYFLENPPQRTFRPGETKASVFKNHCERIIASALMIEPGAMMLQRPVYDERFDVDFANHVVDKIEILDDDPDDIRELKQAVIDTKKEFAARMKGGERPSDILNAHMDAMFELGKYKRQLMQVVNEYRDDADNSDQDVEDFVNAANAMLREKGATELPMPHLFSRQARLRAIERKKGTN